MANVASASAAATLAVSNVPAGTNRIVMVEGFDGAGNPLLGSVWEAVATVASVNTSVTLMPQTTAVGRVFSRWLATGHAQLASTTAASAVASQLDAIVSANALPNYALLNAEAYAGTRRGGCVRQPLGRYGLRGIAGLGAGDGHERPLDNVTGTLWVDDPVSPAQNGVCPLTSLSSGTYIVGPIAPGTWHAWIDVPGLGQASASVTVVSGATASVSLAYPGWLEGPPLPTAVGRCRRDLRRHDHLCRRGSARGRGQQYELLVPQYRPGLAELDGLAGLAGGQRPGRGGDRAADSKLYIVGGVTATQILADAMSLDLTTPSSGWRELPGSSAPLPSFNNYPWSPLGAVVWQGKVLTLWTFLADLAAPPYASSHYTVYDPSCRRGPRIPAGTIAMRTPRRFAGMASLDGDIVVAGGVVAAVGQGQAPSGTTLPAVATVEALEGNSWVFLADLPTPRSELGLAHSCGATCGRWGASTPATPP